ncbi:MAG: exonuclease domain-containing protein [Eubacteriales bacterium]|nr:exonuclease domain-containing protein [Eubacteriales bacterium]
MYDFIAIDFETATNEMNSACSLGIACVDKFEIQKTYYFLIQPPENKYLANNTDIHGLSALDTVNAPLFPAVWSEIKELFSDSIVVAHNARFDMSVLKSCFDFYGIEMVDFQYIDSIAISNRVINDKNYGQSLIDRAAYFNIPIENHHNSLDDAVTCANIVISSVKTTNRKSLKTYCSSFRRRTTHIFSELKPMTKMPNHVSFGNKQPKISSIVPTAPAIDPNHPFNGKNIVLTGDLETLTRAAAMQKIVDVGGVIKSSVSAKTHYVIVGKQDASVVGSDGMSTKERKAHELIKSGKEIKILHEKEFLELLQ